MKRELKNEILVGNKPVTKYLVTFGVLSSKYDEVVIKARGKYIPKAISLTEAIRKLYGWIINFVRVHTEEIVNDGKRYTLPAIEILLKK